MKKIIAVVAVSLFSVSSFAFAGEFLNLEERQAILCGNTFDGKHMKSGWTWKAKSHDTCDKSTVTYLTGKKAGKTFTRPLTGYPNGEVCVKLENGKEPCNKAKDAGDGTIHLYATNGKWSGKHVVTLSNIVKGN